MDREEDCFDEEMIDLGEVSLLTEGTPGGLFEVQNPADMEP